MKTQSSTVQDETKGAGTNSRDAGEVCSEESISVPVPQYLAVWIVSAVIVIIINC